MRHCERAQRASVAINQQIIRRDTILALNKADWKQTFSADKDSAIVSNRQTRNPKRSHCERYPKQTHSANFPLRCLLPQIVIE